MTCTDPTCFPVQHSREDHTDPKAVERILAELRGVTRLPSSSGEAMRFSHTDECQHPIGCEHDV